MDTAGSEAAPPESKGRAERFFVNIFWVWITVAANVITGFFVAPVIIRGLGDDRYGVWVLVFATAEYLFLLDFGFRSAVVNFVSQLRVREEWDSINGVVSTALASLSAVGAILGLGAILAGDAAASLFQISPALQSDFARLIQLIGVTWAAGIVFSVFQSGLDAFQCFRISNQIQVSILLVRSSASVVLVWLGYGLVSLGVVVVVTQICSFLLMAFAFRRAFPRLEISWRLVRWDRWKDLAGFGSHSLLVSVSTSILNQGPPVAVGHFLAEAFVGYYALASRLLQYIVEMVTRIGFITAPSTADLLARGQIAEIVSLGKNLNRYSILLFAPFSVFLSIYGTELIRLWIGESFAVHSAPLLIVFVISTTFAVAGQFNTCSILFGLRKHAGFARSVTIEALLLAVTLLFVIPRYGIMGAAAASAVLTVINRGFITPWLACRHLKYSYFDFMRGIYEAPLQVIVPACILAYGLKLVVPGESWFQLACALSVLTVFCYGTGLLTGVQPQHRALMWSWIETRVRRRVMMR